MVSQNSLSPRGFIVTNSSSFFKPINLSSSQLRQSIGDFVIEKVTGWPCSSAETIILYNHLGDVPPPRVHVQFVSVEFNRDVCELFDASSATDLSSTVLMDDADKSDVKLHTSGLK